jgi:hypothetical protein
MKSLAARRKAFLFYDITKFQFVKGNKKERVKLFDTVSPLMLKIQPLFHY